jgi:tetratricopeptide (TPR) repeat protein
MSTITLLLLLAASGEAASVKALLARARTQMQAQDTAGARDTVLQALALAPNSEDVLSAHVQVSLAARTPLPALRALEPLTRMCPEVASYHYLRGVALLQAGDSPAATESLQEAARLEPDRPLTLVALGLALNTRKQYVEAGAALARALELEPDNVEALAALAEAEEGKGELDLAEAHASRVLERAPRHATAHLVRGLLLMKRERYAEARDALLRAVDADPDSARSHYQLSLAWSRLGDEAQAEHHRQLYQKRRQQTEERILELRGHGTAPPEQEKPR